MASDNGYTTTSALEEFTGIDYSAIDSSYTDSVLEAKISFAEALVIEAEGDTHTGTIPNKVARVTQSIAADLMRNQMIQDGYLVDRTPKAIKNILADLEAIFQAESSLYSDTRGIFVSKGENSS